jgi:integrase
VGIYCRALKTIFNAAIDMRIISRDQFPFGLRRYVIPSGKRLTRKAFTREEKNLILSYRSKREDVNWALDIWAYLYFSSGCNAADLAYLQNRNIEGNFVTFDRKKTENTERNKQSITVHLNDPMREIIARHGNKSLDPGAYVFPVLRPKLTSKDRKIVIHAFIVRVNRLLAEAQKEINTKQAEKNLPPLSVKLTTGTARYTAATLLKRHGIDLSLIAKTLGHGSEATTEHYTEEERETQLLISRALSL